MSSLITPEAIQQLFASSGNALPRYVPAMGSIIIGVVVSIILLASGTLAAFIDRAVTKQSTNFITRTRWIVVLILTGIIAVYIGEFVQDKHYTFKCIRLNRQHFANVHWLRLYSRAIAGHY